MTRLLRKLRSNDVLKLPYNNICCCILYHTNELQQCLYLVVFCMKVCTIDNLSYITVLEVFTISVSRSHRLYLKWISCKCLNSASQISLASLNDRRKKAICFFYQCVTYLECMKYWSVFFSFFVLCHTTFNKKHWKQILLFTRKIVNKNIYTKAIVHQNQVGK